MKKRKQKLPVKLLAGLTIAALALFFAVMISKAALKNSRIFNIRDIVISGPASNKIDVSFLLGRNIIAMDLEEEQRNILAAYPGYKKIKLIRVLPDRLFAYFIQRQPVACVKLQRYFCVDNEAVLFDLPVGIANLSERLPVICGIEKKILSPRIGRQYNVTELLLAIRIIKAINKNPQLRGLKIKKIDVSSPANAAFTISLPVAAAIKARPEQGIEIKIGQDSIEDKINILAGILIQGRHDWAGIKYIDLRFNQPVIKFKEQ